MTVRATLLPLGYVHRRELLDRGWRPDALRRAIAAEGLLVHRRQWIVRPDAPASIHAAARSGGKVTCVAAATLLGVWRPGHDTAPHIALQPHSSSMCPDAVVHRSIGVVPRQPFRLLDPIENVLSVAASCLPFDEALSVWESALHERVVDAARLAQVRWRGDRARELAQLAGVLSDSGLETLFVHRLRRVGVMVAQQARAADRNVDGLIGARLVVQLDGFAHHHDARQRRDDIAHDRALRLAGYTVLRYDYHQIVNEWPSVQAQILAAIAQGLHRVPERPRIRTRRFGRDEEDARPEVLASAESPRPGATPRPRDADR